MDSQNWARAELDDSVRRGAEDRQVCGAAAPYAENYQVGPILHSKLDDFLVRLSHSNLQFYPAQVKGLRRNGLPQLMLNLPGLGGKVRSRKFPQHMHDGQLGSIFLGQGERIIQSRRGVFRKVSAKEDLLQAEIGRAHV